MMDEKQLQEIYNSIISRDPSYKDDISFDVFKQKMSENEYRKKITSWLGADTPGVKTQTGPLTEYQKQAIGTAQPKAKDKIGQLVSDINLGKVDVREWNKAPEFLDKQLSSVTPELLSQQEEFVVPKLKYQFEPLGFKFEEFGAGDNMRVTSPDKKTIEVSLDDNGNIKDTERLKNFLKYRSLAIPNLSNFEKEYQKEKTKITSEKEASDYISSFSKKQDLIRSNIKEIYRQRDLIQDQIDDLPSMQSALGAAASFFGQGKEKYSPATEEEKIKLADLIKKRSELDKKLVEIVSSSEYKSLQDDRSSLSKSIGAYTEMKSQQGDMTGAIFNSLLTGYGRMSADVMGGLIAQGAVMFGEQTGMQQGAIIKIAEKKGIEIPIYAKKDKNGFESWFKNIPEDLKKELLSSANDLIQKTVKYGALDESTGLRTGGFEKLFREAPKEILGDKNITKEYEDLKKSEFWAGSVLGLAESAPAFLMPGGWAAKTAAMFALTEDYVREEMSKDPDFEKISESEKSIIVAPYAIASAALETIGIRNVLASKGLLNNLIYRALNNTAGDISSKSFAEFIKNDVKSGLARGTLTLVGASLAEAETGASQRAVEIGIKEIYNSAKGKEMFKDLPKTFSEIAKDVIINGAQEAVGGGILGSMHAVSAGYRKQGFLGMGDTQFKMFEAAAKDPVLQSAFIANLKSMVNSGEITMEEAKETLNSYRNSVGLFNSIPEELNTNDKKKSMNLLKERRDLERQIEGKDPALVAPITERIKSINESLTKISQNAIQEQTTNEGVLRQEGPQVGLQEMVQGDQGTGIEGAQQRQEQIAAAPAQITGLSISDPEVDTRVTDEKQKGVLSFARKAVSAISSIMPGVEFVVHDNSDSYTAAVAQRLGKESKDVAGTSGYFTYGADGSVRIDVDLSKANSRTVAHEVAHAVLYKKFNDDFTLYKDFRDRLSGVISSMAPQDFVTEKGELTTVKKQLEDFVSRYEKQGENVKADEFITELSAMLANNEAKISTSGWNKISSFVGDFVSKITGGKINLFEGSRTTRDVVDFFNSMSKSIAAGEDLSGVNFVRPNMQAKPRTTPAPGFNGKASMLGDLVLKRNFSNEDIKQGATIKDIGDGDVHLTFSDRLSTGKMGDKEMLGGILHAAATGNFWASSKPTSASRIINASKKAKRDSDGYFTMMPALMSTESQMSSRDLVEIVLAEAKAVVNSKEVKESDMLSRIRRAMSRAGLESDFNKEISKSKKKKSIDNIISATEKVIYGEKSTFENRKKFNESLLGNADLKESARLGSLPTFTQLASTIAEPLSLGHEKGDVILAIKTKGELRSVKINPGEKGYHPSYEYVIKSFEPDGVTEAKVETIVFKNAYNAIDLFPSFKKTDGADVTFDGYKEKYGDTKEARDRYLNMMGMGRLSSSVTEKPRAEAVEKKPVAKVFSKASRTTPEGTEKNDAAKTQGFFSDVVSGLSDKYKPIKPWAPVVGFTKDQSRFKSIFDKYMGNFDMHIATSIPTFRETQVKVGNAITEMYSGSDGALIYDLGGSEGGFVKAITESSNGSIKSINLDPNPEMAAAHNSKPVDGSEVIQEAFYSGFEENGVEYKAHVPREKADVVHESMMFQFITPERDQYIKEIKDKYIKEDGLFLTEEKFSQEKSVYDANEKKKAEYKDEYYTKEQQAVKSDDVLVGMKENQADLNKYKKTLEENFNYVAQYWDSGNFKGFVASDSKSKIDQFIEKVGDTSSEFSSPSFKPAVKGKASRTAPLITDKKILSQMTEDNDGNFLFYHISPNKISGKIDPKFFGRNLRTGRDERTGIGISMYYTRPDRADVSGDYKYVATIPKEKVYPFNSDPLDLYDKAKASFEKMYPGQAFDPNKQVAFISREAEKLGYQMTVAKWGDGLRAQTTKAIKPEWLERPNGNKIEVNEKFKDFKANAKTTVKGKASRLAPENEVSEKTLPGYDSLVAGIAKYVSNAISRGDAKADIIRTAVDIAQSSPIYESANDVQREQIVREARKAAGASQKSSPSVSRLFGIKPKDVTMTELQSLNKQISDLARGARDSKNDINERRRNLSDAVRKLAASGNVSAKKVAAIINKISNLNLYNTKKVNDFIKYATNVFADADYAEKLNVANATRKQIKKLSKGADKFANLRDLGSRFSEIDPSLVSDIDEYNNIASLVKESIKGSTVRGEEVRFARIANEEQINEYISDTIESQDQQLLDAKIEEAQDLLGFDATGMTYDEILELLEPNKTIAKDVENIIRAGINKAFDIYKTIINDILSTGVDSFTGDPVNYTENQKRVISEFININPGDLKIKNALEAVDALVNFITNGSIAKMESVVERYNGEQNMIRANRNGVKARALRKYGSKLLGQLLIEQTASLNILFERMFGGFTSGGFMEKMMGITDIKNGVSKAKSEADAVVKKYVEMFYNKKANGQDFNTAYNNIERGMIAFLVREISGTQKEIKAEFDRRKNLVTESINQLEKGNDQEKEKARIYQEVFDKIAKNSNNFQDVANAADATNLDAVSFWIDNWIDRYQTLSDVALGIYNKVLGRDANYTPDRFSKLSYGISEVDMSSEDMSFIFNSGNASFYKKETGVLMKVTRPETLPTERYVDLSFDNNNANSLYDALVDVNTAGAIRRSESAMNSSAFQNIVESVDDRKLLVRRVKLYVNNVRKKSPFSDDTFSTVAKRLNRLATIGVGQALGGVLQPIKQVVPIAINTLINAGGLNVSSMSNKSIQDFINKSGYAIANRGIESQAQIETLDKMIDQAASSRGAKALEKIEAANKWWLKNFLVKFDVAIARASWITYYEQYLKKEGLYETVVVNQTTASGTLTVSVPGIDYSNHKLNKDAADYAQRQVDRQQNVSDSDLSGAILSSKDPAKQLFTKVVMPFASFRMNQSARLGSDISTLLNKTATKEDKKIAARSALGFMAEMATFRAISYGSALVIANTVGGLMDRDDDDEKEKKRKEAILKGQITSAVPDMFSPAPILDKLIQAGVQKTLESAQDIMNIDKEDRVGIYSGNKQTFLQSLGLLGVTAERASQLWETVSLSVDGEFTDDYGKRKKISDKNMSTLGMLAPISILSSIGLAPTEVSSIVRGAVKIAKSDAESLNKESKKQSRVNKEDLKKLDPQLYKEIYGPSGINEEVEKIKEEFK